MTALLLRVKESGLFVPAKEGWRSSITMLLAFLLGTAGVITGDLSTSDAVATTIGLAATCASLLVALVIFRWTQSVRDRDVKTMSVLSTDIKTLLRRADNQLDKEEELDGEVADGPEAPASPAGAATIVLHGHTYSIAPATSFSASWWVELIGRVQRAVDSADEHAPVAFEVLRSPLGRFSQVATFEKARRGKPPHATYLDHRGHRLERLQRSRRSRRALPDR